YVYFGSYGLVSYDLNGNLKWERRLPLPENPYGAVASPIVAGELLVLNHQGKDAYLLGVNRRDGRTVWKTARSMFQYGWSTPVHWRHDGIDNGGIVFCRVAKTGEVVYSGRLGAPGYYYSSPVAADNKVYIASEEGVVVVLDAGEQLKILATNKL